MYIVIAILMFSFLIFIHELGHFITAKLFDVKVNEFAVFMGPSLLHWGKGETKYSLRLLPVGGYCAMEGEDGSSQDPRAFTAKAAWKRVIILAAGAGMNFLTGLLILIVIHSTCAGFRTLEVTGFMEGCPLQGENALQEGDILRSIDHRPLLIFSDFSMITERVGEGVTEVEVERDGKRVQLTLDLTKQDYLVDGQTRHLYGLTLGGSEARSVSSVLRNSWLTSLDFARMVLYGLEDLFGGGASLSDMSGPVGIVDTIQETGTSSETTGEGLQNVFYLCAFIAVNLAFMNLLPIPALDGGHIFFLIITVILERLLGRKIDPKYESYIHMAGLVLLLTLMVFVTFQDVFKIIFGG